MEALPRHAQVVVVQVDGRVSVVPLPLRLVAVVEVDVGPQEAVQVVVRHQHHLVVGEVLGVHHVAEGVRLVAGEPLVERVVGHGAHQRGGRARGAEVVRGAGVPLGLPQAGAVRAHEPRRAQLVELAHGRLQRDVRRGAEVAHVPLAAVEEHGLALRGLLLADVPLGAPLRVRGRVKVADLVGLAGSWVEVVAALVDHPGLKRRGHVRVVVGVGVYHCACWVMGCVIVEEHNAMSAVVGSLKNSCIWKVNVSATRAKVARVCFVIWRVTLVGQAGLDVVRRAVVVGEPLVQRGPVALAVVVALGVVQLVLAVVVVGGAEVRPAPEQVDVGGHELAEEVLLVEGVHLVRCPPRVELEALVGGEVHALVRVHEVLLGGHAVHADHRLEGRGQVRAAAGVGHRLAGADGARGAPHALAHLAQLPVLAPGALGAGHAGEAVLLDGRAVGAGRADVHDERARFFAGGAGRAGVTLGGLNGGCVVARQTLSGLDGTLELAESALGRGLRDGRAFRTDEPQGAHT
mmetsp:Transcript_15669/g.27723  ORF Transcript_15669/g.27723 Transcript_15669/m.27723 type:complete len:518 (-) Transcript_15669:4597-6150(-)